MLFLVLLVVVGNIEYCIHGIMDTTLNAFEVQLFHLCTYPCTYVPSIYLGMHLNYLVCT